MKAVRLALALAGASLVPNAPAISLDDIQLWTGAGTNRAALVIEWNAPQVFNNSSVPPPIANKTLVWGYRFDGSASATEMLEAVVAADPKLYIVADVTFGTYVESIGYNLNGDGLIGITDGAVTNSLTNRFFLGSTVSPDAVMPVNPADLFWSGYYGPNWQLWTELGDNGGFATSPNRGASPYWDPDTAIQGQWEFANYGLDELPLTNGSWIGYSVAAAGYDSDTNDAAYYAFNDNEQAPPSPDGTYVAYVCNTNDFGVQVVSTNGIDPISPYNDPTAVLGRPALDFVDPFDGGVTNRASIIDDPYNVAPDGSALLTRINVGGEITVKLGRPVYADPNHPYGIDFIVYGNSFFNSVSGVSGTVGDGTDLSAVTLNSSGIYGHATTVSVSQDGTNWFPYPVLSHLFPDNAYRWDDTNSSWTDEGMNPNKPLNPIFYTNVFTGQSVAAVLDQFGGAAGGTGFSIGASGLPWIQYVRVQPGTGSYTVIDAIAAVNPAVVGDALCIGPDNLASGITNLAFQQPDNPAMNQVSINFASLSDMAKISVVSLSEFSSFAPVMGNVSSACQIRSWPLTRTNAVSFRADLGFRTGNGYSGDGTDLRLYRWGGTNWTCVPFSFNVGDNELWTAGVTNFSAFVIAQIIPSLDMLWLTNGLAVQINPVANCPHTLERSEDLVKWGAVWSFTATNAQPVLWLDATAPEDQAFYRVRAELP